MLHLDLFSGIGGFAIATEMVWDNVEHIFCDNDLFCQAILKKHWPGAPIYGDIGELIADTKQPSYRTSEKRGEINAQKSERPPGWFSGRAKPDLLTGGFPCQPFSQAGRRQGTADDRYLWPHMFAVIRNTQPTWVIAENVGGLVTWNNGLVLEQVCTDLESENYEVQPFIIPAVSVNAPHRRDRVWIVAHASSSGARNKSGTITDERGRASTGRREGIRQVHREISPSGIDSADSDDPNSGSNSQGLPEWASEGQGSGHKRYTPWDEDWPEVAARLCTLDDGLRYDVVRPDGGRDAEIRPRPKGWRNSALKGAGNAIVPQVAAEIMLRLIK